MNVIVACETNQEILEQFLLLGHDAISCDLKPAMKGLPHYQGSIFDIINGHKKYFKGKLATLLIGHPPCTFNASSGAQWKYHPDDKHLPKIRHFPALPKLSLNNGGGLKDADQFGSNSSIVQTLF